MSTKEPFSFRAVLLRPVVGHWFAFKIAYATQSLSDDDFYSLVDILEEIENMHEENQLEYY